MTLLIHGNNGPGEYVHITPERAGWQLLHFAARRMEQGQRWQGSTGETEYALVMLGGVCHAQTSRGVWERIGRRRDVFDGIAATLYLPRQTDFTISAVSETAHIAYGWCATDEDHPVRLVTPQEVEVEIRGGGNATRQINDLIPPGFDCHRLVVVEVYTPSGNWSSYPPHKHDEHVEDEAGNVLEADLEEIYFYQMDRAEGYAYQRVYTGDGRRDELVCAGHGDAVLVPEGYHPVVSAHGYTTYYLNFLAGSAQSLANSDDPAHAWIKASWREQDPRLPLVTAPPASGMKGK